MELTAIWSRPETEAATMMGTPMAPKATGAVLAIRATPRAPERRKAKANKHGRSDCHRGAETCRTFDEATEGIGDKQGLETPVIGKAGKGIFDYFKFARFHGHVVNPDCRYDNPDNGEETESGSHQC